MLSLPGVGKTSVGGTTPGEGATVGAGGVVGEQDEPPTAAAMLGSSLLSVAGIAIFAPALALAVVAPLRRGRRPDVAG